MWWRLIVLVWSVVVIIIIIIIIIIITQQFDDVNALQSQIVKYAEKQVICVHFNFVYKVLIKMTTVT